MLDIKSQGLGFDPHPGDGDFLRVHDRCIRTLINHSQDLGMSRLRPIIHKTWAYQDSNKSSQVIGISVLLFIIRKSWAYQLRHDQSFARLGLFKIPINHSQNFAYQDSDQLFTRLGHIKTDQSFARLGHIRKYAHYELHMPVLPMIDRSLVND